AKSDMIGDGEQPGQKGVFTAQVRNTLMHGDKHLKAKVTSIFGRETLAEEKRRDRVVVFFKQAAEFFFRIAAIHKLPNDTSAGIFWHGHAAYHRGGAFDKQGCKYLRIYLANFQQVLTDPRDLPARKPLLYSVMYGANGNPLLAKKRIFLSWR